MNNIFHIETRDLLRLERTINLLCQGGRAWGRGGWERGEGGMTAIHILMAPQYLNNNHVTYYDWVYAEQWHVIRNATFNNNGT